MGYVSEWVEEVKKPAGVRLEPRLLLRQMGIESEWTAAPFGVAPFGVAPFGGGLPTYSGTGHMITLTENNAVQRISPIRTRRERVFGVVQSQDWQVVLSDPDRVLRSKSLVGHWIELQAGPGGDPPRETMATGRVVSARSTTDQHLVLDVRHPLQWLIDAQLEREIGFYLNGWVSPVYVEDVTEGSGRYTGTLEWTYAHLGSPPYSAKDTTLRFVFVSSTEYILEHEDGTPQGLYSIDQDQVLGFAMPGGVPWPPNFVLLELTVAANGWSQEQDAYAAGDRYVFYASLPRETEQLHAMGLVKHILDNVLDIRSVDVEAGEVISGISNAAAWDFALSVTADDPVYGHFPAGTRVIDMVQQLLQMAHASIFPSRDGGVSVWISYPQEGAVKKLNGNPDTGPVEILAGGYDESMDELCESVTYTYLTLGSGHPAAVSLYAALDEEIAVGGPRKPLVVRSGWQARGTAMRSACQRALRRYSSGRRMYDLKTTLAGAAVTMDGYIEISESRLGLTDQRTQVTETELDLRLQAARVIAWDDPVVTGSYSRVGVSRVGSTEERVW